MDVVVVVVEDEAEDVNARTHTIPPDKPADVNQMGQSVSQRVTETTDRIGLNGGVVVVW